MPPLSSSSTESADFSVGSLLEDALEFHPWKLIFPGKVMLSRGAAELFGLPAGADEITLEAFVEAHHPGARKALVAAVGAALQSRRRFRMTLRLGTLDRHVETIADVQLRDDKVVGIAGASRNATADVALAAAAGRANLATAAISEMPAPVVVLDRHMRVIDCSRHWLKSHRLIDRSDAVGHNFYTLLPQTPDSWRAEHDRALAGETVRTRRRYIVAQTKEPLDCEVIVKPWQSGGGIGGIMILAGWSRFGFSQAAKPVETADRNFTGSLLELADMLTDTSGK